MNLRCPLSKKWPVEPVKFVDGNVYDKAALIEHSLRNDGLYLNVLVDPKGLVPDLQRLVEIEAVVEQSKGTKETLEWHSRRSKMKQEAAMLEKAEIDKSETLLYFVEHYIRKNEYVNALRTMESLEKPTAKIHMLRGDCCDALGRTNEAFAHYAKATSSTHENAHWKIAELFRREGRHAEALKWNEIAANKRGLWGKEQHVRIVAEAYMNGDNVEQDVDKAMVWYKKLGTAYKDHDALFLCAQDCFVRGDRVGCVRLLLSASEKGNEQADEKLAMLDRLFDSDEVVHMKRPRVSGDA
jgi:tetratricopeptide (TPR) repeat protein